MKKYSKLILLLALLVLPLNASAADRTPAPKDAKAYIIYPANGARIYNPVTIRFGLIGMGIAPAGVEMAKTGHFHLLLDEENLPDMSRPLPFGAHYLHFSEGHIEVTLDLSAGKHTLQLIMGDHRHIPHKPPVISRKIRITVEKFY